MVVRLINHKVVLHRANVQPIRYCDVISRRRAPCRSDHQSRTYTATDTRAIAMGATSLDKIKALQRNAAYVRNLCILAHVDHGKFTARFLHRTVTYSEPNFTLHLWVQADMTNCS
ncbi:hypothetical protein GOODEAATRI_033531 [Goodea atripinnis]|uniref:Tr-type G domain-containing protein n=1 Tax=Goodea atripinnis TaxID=208336 RepID=A0ABV0PJ96_9TELE